MALSNGLGEGFLARQKGAEGGKLKGEILLLRSSAEKANVSRSL